MNVQEILSGIVAQRLLRVGIAARLQLPPSWDVISSVWRAIIAASRPSAVLWGGRRIVSAKLGMIAASMVRVSARGHPHRRTLASATG
jgi:hypothetical protein